VRPTPLATVSAPITWKELERDSITIEQFRLENMRERLNELGDLWKPLLKATARYDLAPLVAALKKVRPRGVGRESSAA
jgi:DNA primase